MASRPACATPAEVDDALLRAITTEPKLLDFKRKDNAPHQRKEKDKGGDDG